MYDPDARAGWEVGVPNVSRFYGIVARMYLHDHEPAHFHARYGEHEALFTVETLDMFRGELPRRAAALVLEWAMTHREDLRTGWALARTGAIPNPIPPLE